MLNSFLKLVETPGTHSQVKARTSDRGSAALHFHLSTKLNRDGAGIIHNLKFSEENILRDANKLADEKGLRFKDRDDFVENYMAENYIPDDHYRGDENGTSHYIRGGETTEEMSMRGQQYAMVNTHTQDSSIKSMRTIHLCSAGLV